MTTLQPDNQQGIEKHDKEKEEKLPRESINHDKKSVSMSMSMLRKMAQGSTVKKKRKEKTIKVFKCNIIGCERTFEHDIDLMRHIIEHSKYQCDRGCGKIYANCQSLKAHVKNKHEKEQFVCSTCGKTYMHRVSLKSHQQTAHTPDNPYRCIILECETFFEKKNQLLTHLNAIHSIPLPE